MSAPSEVALATPRAWRAPLLRHGPHVLGACLLVVALWVLHTELFNFHYQDLDAEISAVGWWRIGLAIACTALSFVALAGYEFFALRFAGRSASLARTTLASFVAQSIAHSTGLGPLVGTGLRFQIYARSGLDLVDVAKVQAFFSATFGLGMTALAGIVLLVEPQQLSIATRIPDGLLRALGGLLLLLVACYLVWGGARGRPLRLLGHEIVLPSAKVTAIQIALAFLDIGAAAAALWFLIPPGLQLGYLETLGIFVAAVLLGVISHVPGGLGVFEFGVVLLARPEEGQTIPLLGALVMFRAVYYFLPLIVGAACLACLEFARQRSRLAGAARALAALGPLVPMAAAALAVLAGAVLLFSGATPAVEDRLALLGDYLPAALIDLAHFLASLVGTVLLLLARPLARRLSGAWLVAIPLLAGGILVSLLKGLDWEEALLLAAILLILLPCRREFYRSTRLLDERLSPGWWICALAILASSIWLVFFAYQHVAYHHTLWWKLQINADAPRSLRAAAGAVVLVALAALHHLLRPAAREPEVPDAQELARARAIVDANPASSARLALTGDKSLLFNQAGTAFIMYAVSGRSWIAMGEPIGPEGAWPELLWMFHDQADRQGARTVFYEIGAEQLPAFLDLGLRLIKLGERARVPLERFDLKGRRRTDLRTAINKAARQGWTFSVLEPNELGQFLPELREVSDSWLQRHEAREKRFSLGFFSEPYLTTGPMAVVRQGERIIAFANLWPGADRHECSIDLMRFAGDTPGIMDFLFASVMLWAKDQGYAWFDLGMAPLSGLPDHRLASLWSGFGRLLVRHGSQFYNFRGLRAFKEKFDPIWEPAYLAYPDGTLPRVLADVVGLVGGGWTGLLTRQGKQSTRAAGDHQAPAGEVT